MKYPDDCAEQVTHSKITLQEKRVKVTFQNPDRKTIWKITIDGCALRQPVRSCDYGLWDEQTEYYIELKGSDIPHGIEQLESTIKHLSSDALKAEKKCYLIGGRIPQSATEIQTYKKRMRKQYNARLTVQKSGNTLPL